jgi:uncharacterized protein YoxC
MNILDIFTIVLLISASALCIALIFYLAKITSSLNAMQKDINEISSEINSLMANVSELTQKIASIAENAEDQIQTSKNIVQSVKNRVDTILSLEERVRGGIEGPLMTLVTNFRAIANGLNTFLSYFKK